MVGILRSIDLDDVALVGPAGVGKDTVASLLVEEYGFTRVAFADALKGALMRVDPQVGSGRLSDLVLGAGWDRAKVNPEVRRLLQEFGMAIRDISPEFWIEATADVVDQVDGPVVITDLRMPNEYEYAVAELGALTVRLSRPDVDTGLGWRAHESERALDDFEFDLEISGDSWTPSQAANAIWMSLQEGSSDD